MNAEALIRQYYQPGTLAYEVMMRHAEQVTQAALDVAERAVALHPDRKFIEEAAMLHDIGIFYTDAPPIGCFGKRPYVCHGYLGRTLLESQGLPAHALVCERHIGVGLAAADIATQNLPLPVRDMVPETLEEQIICFADNFFSKIPAPQGTIHTADAVAASLARFGRDKVGIFCQWLARFGEPSCETTHTRAAIKADAPD